MHTNTTDKKGNITAYGFACGNILEVSTDSLQKEIYKESNTYHVRSLRNNTPALNTKFTGGASHKFIIWESFYRLKDAKTLFNKIK